MVPNDVVQFNENHKWCGCFGFVREVKNYMIMVGVPIPQQGTAYIYCSPDDVEFIGNAVLVPKDEEENDD